VSKNIKSLAQPRLAFTTHLGMLIQSAINQTKKLGNEKIV
jgi:hypothetical protein